MTEHPLGSVGRLVVGALAAVVVFLPMAAAPAHAGARVYEKDDFTLELGMRLQPRMELEMVPALSGNGKEWRRDFLVRRSRWKANGTIKGGTFGFEWRLDKTDAATDLVDIGLENGWIMWPLSGKQLQVRAGLYDQPYSRDRLTSDSKQLVVDRGNVSNVPAGLGMADNVVGIELRGDLQGGRYVYAVGAFDNRTIRSVYQQVPMFVGRIDLNLGATGSIYQDAHFGDESWYCIGINGGYQSSLRDTSITSAGTTVYDKGSNGIAGVDAMIDIPAGPGRLLAVTEYNNISLTPPEGGNSLDWNLVMVGAGYLVLDQKLQGTVRWDHVSWDVSMDQSLEGRSRDVVYAGANYYHKGHNLKIQGDLRFQSSTGEALDGIRLQGQVDF